MLRFQQIKTDHGFCWQDEALEADFLDLQFFRLLIYRDLIYSTFLETSDLLLFGIPYSRAYVMPSLSTNILLHEIVIDKESKTLTVYYA